MLYIDLDGVLADFDAHVEALFGAHPSALPLSEMWHRAERAPAFFESMPITPDGRLLWEFCRPFAPEILTGLPRGDWAEAQKRAWVRHHLGQDVIVHTCMSRDKCLYARPGDALVDDTQRHERDWVRRGGVFIHHRSARDSIRQLVELGFGVAEMPHPQRSGLP